MVGNGAVVRFIPSGEILPNGLRRAPDGGPPLREDEAVPMPVEISFSDLLANLNPLHHIPVVGWVFRAVTGETVNPAFRALGGFLFGGPIGAIASAVGAMVESLFSGAPERHAGGAVSIEAAAVPSVQREKGATVVASAAADSAQPLAVRLGARLHPPPASAAMPPLASSRGSGDPAFAAKMLRGLEAYERTLRARDGLPPPELTRHPVDQSAAASRP